MNQKIIIFRMNKKIIFNNKKVLNLIYRVCLQKLNSQNLIIITNRKFKRIKKFNHETNL